MPIGHSSYVSALRHELIARNSSYASLNLLPHVTSYGELPVVVYQQSECGRHHGNFISASYKAILRRPQWRKRLQKVHSQGRRSLPARDGSWRELDSSVSSDALLMNTFCYPRRDTEKGDSQNSRARSREAPRIWIHAPCSTTQRRNRADRN
jgi:hypothetical protein